MIGGIRAVFTASLLISIATCGKSNGSSIPERPDHVPESASWRGGIDGGAWVQCEQANGKLKCQQFHLSGSMMIEQEYVLCSKTPFEELYGVSFDYTQYTLPIKESIILMPIAPPKIHVENRLDEMLTMKAQQEFEDNQNALRRGSCWTEFYPFVMEK